MDHINKNQSNLIDEAYLQSKLEVGDKAVSDQSGDNEHEDRVGSNIISGKVQDSEVTENLDYGCENNVDQEDVRLDLDKFKKKGSGIN